MGDASELCYAPSTSLLDHCRQLGEKHDPTRFATSVPGGIWDLPECRGEGVAIKRVEHKVNGDGFIFTPQDHANFPQGWTQTSARETAMETEERAVDCMPSASLQDFCGQLATRHNPVQFATSLPGGCWAAASPPFVVSSEGKESDAIPIRRVEHRMNGEGLIFTPSQNTLPLVVGSLGSEQDSEVGSWGTPAQLRLFQDKNAFLAETAIAVAAATAPPTAVQSSPEQAVANIVAGMHDESVAFGTPPDAKSLGSSPQSSEPASPKSPPELLTSSGEAGTPTSQGHQGQRPRWMQDHEADICCAPACDKQFRLLTRRHHCRACGRIFCGACSTSSFALPHLGYMQPVRVCDACSTEIRLL